MPVKRTMLIKKKKAWHIDERHVTPESVYMSRRRFLISLGIGAIGAGAALWGCDNIFSGAGDKGGPGPVKTPTSHLYPAPRNPIFTVQRPLTPESVAANYNNFYEFSSGKKNILARMGGFRVRPWQVEVTGLVENPKVYDIDELVRMMELEERVYRFRCVEAWAMTVPWTGFPMRDFVKRMTPLSGARFVRFTSFYNPDVAPAQKKRFWLPWPYEEGLTMEEAVNELTMLVTGIYGHELPPQHGAPLRLITPWKYGFKSIKSIVRIEFTDKRPATFWNTLAPQEYDFTANVDPRVPHPRWSQEMERLITTGEWVKTRKFNGYEEFVRDLYRRL